MGDTYLPNSADVQAISSALQSLTNVIAAQSGGAKRYGFRRTKSESDPDTRIVYLYDAVGMTAAAMDYTNDVFDYGSWEAFVNEIARPVMLTTAGEVDYELNHDDQNYKLDGTTASDIADTSYDGNAMTEFGGAYKWVKRYEDSDYEYVIFSNIQYDSDYKAYAHTNALGYVGSAFYYGMFDGTNISSKYRSVGTGAPTVSTTREQEITYSKANGAGYYTMTKSQWDYIMDLLTLISKSDDLQTAFGQGYSASTNTAKINNGTMLTEGAFWGESAGTSGVKVFWIENFWGNIWQGMAGLILDTDEYYVKMAPPYCDTPVSDADYSAYTDVGVTAPSNGYVKDNYNSELGFLPVTVGGAASTYFCDYFYKTATDIRYALVGGGWNHAANCGRYVRVYNLASSAASHLGSRLSYTPV